MQTVWVAEKQDISANSTLFAIYGFEDIFNILCEEKYITEKTLVDVDENLGICPVLEAYGIKKIIKEKNDES